jgi:Flp pilus assembly protein CpaB
LEVTPRQAQILSLADEYAVLRLSLRPFGEENLVPVSPFATKID